MRKNPVVIVAVLLLQVAGVPSLAMVLLAVSGVTGIVVALITSYRSDVESPFVESIRIMCKFQAVRRSLFAGVAMAG